jgi:hypothetical protein
MGQPVVHFEIVGQDAEKLQSHCSELFVEVPDVEASLARAERLGGTLIQC